MQWCDFKLLHTIYIKKISSFQNENLYFVLQFFSFIIFDFECNQTHVTFLFCHCPKKRGCIFEILLGEKTLH
jgi:hypothetical protein